MRKCQQKFFESQIYSNTIVLQQNFVTVVNSGLFLTLRDQGGDMAGFLVSACRYSLLKCDGLPRTQFRSRVRL